MPREILASLLLPLYNMLNSMFASNVAQISPQKDDKGRDYEKSIADVDRVKDLSVRQHHPRMGRGQDEQKGGGRRAWYVVMDARKIVLKS